MTPKAREHRFRRLKEMGCIACWLDGRMDVYPEIHHLNFDGKAGQERLGDQATIPLCPWHHQGKPGIYKTSYMRENVGPSLAKQSRAFRAKYGTDDQLLAKVDDLIEQMEGVANGTRHHEITPQRRACP